MESLDRDSWKRVGSSFDVAAFRRRQEEHEDQSKGKRGGLSEVEHLDSTDRIVGLTSKSQVLVSATTLRFYAILIVGRRCGIFGSRRGLAGRQHDQRQRCTAKCRPLWKG